MTFIKFLFVILIVLPVGVILYFLLQKLVDEYNAAVKKSQEVEARRKAEVQEPVQRDYRKENPRYDAYRKKMEWKQKHAANIEDRQNYADERQRNYQEAAENTAALERGKQPARSKRKRRKERKNKKRDREKDRERE